MKIINKIFAILSIVILTTFLISCGEDDLNEDYTLVLPKVENLDGLSVVFIDETQTYSVTPTRGGSEYIWSVDGAVMSPVEGRTDKMNITFNQVASLVTISIVERAANGKESDAIEKEVKVFDTPCDWTIEMQDSWGDGWDGASLSFSFDDYPASDFTIDDGASNTETIAVPNNSNVKVTFTSGAYDGEITYQILDSNGTVIFSDGTSPTVGLAFETLNICP